MQRKLQILLCLVLLAGSISGTVWASSAAPEPAPAPQMAGQGSLYARLGGYDALAAVTDDFIGRLVTDPKIGRFFVGFSTDSKTRIRQHVVDFLCVATGGPCKYTGRSMEVSHTGLNITEEDWNLAVQHLGETLNKFKVPAKEQGEVVNAIAPLKSQIVGR